MTFLISLALAELFLLLCAKPLKKHPAIFYGAAALVSAVVIGLYWAAPEGIPRAILNKIPVWMGAFGTACFVEVMAMGAMPNGHERVKKGMPIRGELSIFACLLTLGHNLSYGKNYLTPGYLFTGPFSATKAAAWVSVVLIVLMLVLTVTSIKAVRRRFPPKKWKALQRWAYLFYGLIYVHVLLVNVPGFLKGRSGCGLTLLAYSAVFLSYALCRVRKAVLMRDGKSAQVTSRSQLTAAGAGMVCSLLVIGGLYLSAPQLASAAAPPQPSEPLVQSLDAQEPDFAPEPPETVLPVTTAPETTAPVEETRPPETAGPEETPEPSESAEPAVEPEAPQPEPVPAAAATELPELASPSEPVETAAPEPVPEAVPDPEPEVTPEAVPEATPEPKPLSKYQDGTFSGTGEGYYGPVTVSVTIAGDVITSIQVTGYVDDDDYFSDAQRGVTSAILAAQSPEVSAVSGATYSSKGIMAAVRDALSHAQN